MLSFEDDRWRGLQGGYRTPFDPRHLLEKLESGDDLKTTWDELWEELYHQGDVGEASYASVPHIVRIHRRCAVPDWNPYAIVAVIELARENERNPRLPEWLEKDYFDAIMQLAEIGRGEFERVDKPEDVRAILSILAISKGARSHARLLVNYSEEEVLKLESPINLTG